MQEAEKGREMMYASQCPHGSQSCISICLTDSLYHCGQRASCHLTFQRVCLALPWLSEWASPPWSIIASRRSSLWGTAGKTLVRTQRRIDEIVPHDRFDKVLRTQNVWHKRLTPGFGAAVLFFPLLLWVLVIIRD